VNRILRHLWFALVVRPVVLVVLGLNVRHRDRLAATGPAIVVANHNSHLDTLVLMTLFPPRQLSHVRPVAAADYFRRSRFRWWFATRVMGIVPLDRESHGAHGDPLEGCDESLRRGEILILYPEGTRGEPEKLSSFKHGLAHLARRHPGVPVIPVFLYGLGKALPKGSALLVPFYCDVVVGQAMQWSGSKEDFRHHLETAMAELAAEVAHPPWE
jgi:1-acyl-sn-glycerol-3-phosphate acyltransferase